MLTQVIFGVKKKKKKENTGSPSWIYAAEISLLIGTAAQTTWPWVYPICSTLYSAQIKKLLKNSLHVAVTGFSVREPLQPFYFGF